MEGTTTRAAALVPMVTARRVASRQPEPRLAQAPSPMPRQKRAWASSGQRWA